MQLDALVHSHADTIRAAQKSEEGGLSQFEALTALAFR